MSCTETALRVILLIFEGVWRAMPGALCGVSVGREKKGRAPSSDQPPQLHRFENVKTAHLIYVRTRVCAMLHDRYITQSRTTTSRNTKTSRSRERVDVEARIAVPLRLELVLLELVASALCTIVRVDLLVRTTTTISKWTRTLEHAPERAHAETAHRMSRRNSSTPSYSSRRLA